MEELLKLQNKIINFRDARKWKQFHTPKDLALSLSLEASELLECFQWKNEEECQKMLAENKDHVAEEMADVFNYLLIMSHDFDIDLIKATSSKVDKNNQKYPVDKSINNHKKYTEL